MAKPLDELEKMKANYISQKPLQILLMLLQALLQLMLDVPILKVEQVVGIAYFKTHILLVKDLKKKMEILIWLHS